MYVRSQYRPSETMRTFMDISIYVSDVCVLFDISGRVYWEGGGEII